MGEIKQLLIGYSDAAVMLGTSYWTIYRLVKSGELPGVRVRGRHKVSLAAVHALASRASLPQQPVTAE